MVRPFRPSPAAVAPDAYGNSPTPPAYAERDESVITTAQEQEKRSRGRPRKSSTPSSEAASHIRMHSRVSQRVSRRRLNDTSVTVINSIRDNARVPSISVGTQSSAGSTYRIDYFRNQRNHQSQSSRVTAAIQAINPSIEEQMQTPTDLTATQLDTRLTAPSPQQGDSNVLPEHNDAEPLALMHNDAPHDPNPRMCICVDYLFPKNCSDCDLPSRHSCERHRPIKCAKDGCHKTFHRFCVVQHLRGDDNMDDNDVNAYLCMECHSTSAFDPEVPDVPFNSLGTRSFREKLGRFGISIPLQPTDAIKREAKQKMMRMKKSMERCMTASEIDDVLDAMPRSYPSAVNMSSDAITKHVMCGRQFEIAMMCYQVSSCTCCGRTQPWHDFDDFPKDDNAPYPRRHFSAKYYPAWHCTCHDVCHGSQFYATGKPKHMSWYQSRHGTHPSNAPGSIASNATLCRGCYEEVGPKGVDQNGTCHRRCAFYIPQTIHSLIIPISSYFIELMYGYKFSLRNGFGPVPRIPILTNESSTQVRNSARLAEVMAMLTPAEEAAIRRITPMVSIVRLTQGNLAAKGNTSCFKNQTLAMSSPIYRNTASI
jgi:hypothetical protein